MAFRIGGWNWFEIDMSSGRISNSTRLNVSEVNFNCCVWSFLWLIFLGIYTPLPSVSQVSQWLTRILNYRGGRFSKALDCYYVVEIAGHGNHPVSEEYSY